MGKYQMKTYVELETGEVGAGIFTPEETILKQEKQRELIKTKIDYEKKVATGDALDFTKGLMENVKELLEELDQSPQTKRTYKGYILQLQTYTNYDNELFLNKQSHKPLNRKGIAELLNIKNRTYSKEFIDIMLELGVLSSVQTAKGKGFAMNSDYSMRGRSSNSQYVKFFHNSIRQVYKENSADDVAFLYSLLPYVSLEDNVLAHNPYEQEPSKLDVMTGKDIAEITGVSLNVVYRKKNRMTFNNLAVFKTETKLGKTNYVINPLVFYRKDGEPNETIVRSFMIKGK